MTQAQELLSSVFHGVQKGWFNLWTKQGQLNRTLWYDLANSNSMAEAAEAARQYDAQGYEVYFSTCSSKMQKGAAERTKQEDVAHCACYFMDIDTAADPQKVNSMKVLPADPMTAYQMLSLSELPPHLCVKSGHGLHAYWLLDSPVQIDSPSALDELRHSMSNFAKAVTAAMGWQGIDTHASEPARVLRIPGTHNHKGGEMLPVELFPAINRPRYSLKELQSFTAQHSPTISKQPPMNVTSAAPTSNGLSDAEIKKRLDVARKARNGDLFQTLYDKGDISGYANDHSAADEALCGMLCFYLNGDYDAIDKAFRSSKLYRPEKWDRDMQKGGDSYAYRTISKAINTHTGGYYKPTPQPITRDRLTIEALAEELTSENCSVRLNDITHKVEVSSDNAEVESFGDLVTTLHSAFAGKYKGCTFETLGTYLEYIAKRNSYNPVLEYLDTLKWTGQDYLRELFALMSIEDDPLSCVLVRKWLLQSYAMLHNTLKAPFGAEGVLTLRGAQRAGKTSLMRRLALDPKWFLGGASIDTRDKDTLRRACTYWIVELGEVESTMKSDVERLKAFITADIDVYRLPYGKYDLEQPRRTSLCATCNSERYLIDTTGNRRWFTVPIDKIMPYEDIQAFNAEQLWAQIVHIATTEKGETASWRLTVEEVEQLNVRNGDSTKLLKGEAEVIDILSQADKLGDACEIRHTTVSAWKDHYNILRAYSVDQISKALTAQGRTSEKKRINGIQQRWIDLPFL